MIFPTLIFKIERWKFNKDFGVYVSTLGNFKDRRKRNLPIKINSGGYCAICTERGVISAHRLVLLTWRPIPEAEQLTVDHKNHNKRDNSLTNLEWVTREENERRAAEDFIETIITSRNKKSINQYYVGKHVFDSVDEAFVFMKNQKTSKNVEKEKLTHIFKTLLKERERGNLRGCVKNYYGYNLTTIKGE